LVSARKQGWKSDSSEAKKKGKNTTFFAVVCFWFHPQLPSKQAQEQANLTCNTEKRKNKRDGKGALVAMS
jgi:hypothetical protein